MSPHATNILLRPSTELFTSVIVFFSCNIYIWFFDIFYFFAETFFFGWGLYLYICWLLYSLFQIVSDPCHFSVGISGSPLLIQFDIFLVLNMMSDLWLKTGHFVLLLDCILFKPVLVGFSWWGKGVGATPFLTGRLPASPLCLTGHWQGRDDLPLLLSEGWEYQLRTWSYNTAVDGVSSPLLVVKIVSAQ